MKTAIIGAGFIADFHADAYRHHAGATLAGVCDVDREKAEALAEKHGCAAYSDAAAMLDELRPDAVSVCLPTFLHEEYVTLALSSGAHVLCEKPFALTLEACERMTRRAEEAGRVLMVGQVLRWWPEYRLIAEELRSGLYGRLRFIQAQRLQHSARGGWFIDPERGGGALFDLYVHDTDFVCSILGTEPADICAHGFRGASGAWRQVSTTFRWESGAVAQIGACSQMPEGYPFTAMFRAEFEDACLEYRFRAPVNIQRGVPVTAEFLRYRDGRTEALPTAEDAQGRAFRDEIGAFLRGADEGVSPLPARESTAVMALIHRVKGKLEA